MSEGGGFCDKHGPFDPPHPTCPYCAHESDERRAFGPPDSTRASQSGQPPAPPAEPESLPEADRPGEDEAAADAAAADVAAADVAAADADDFVRATVEPGDSGDPTDVTEMVSRPDFVPEEEMLQGPEPPPLAWLIVREPVEQRGTVIPVRANQSIGREGDVRWNDPRLSRLHARLTFESPRDDAPTVSENATHTALEESISGELEAVPALPPFSEWSFYLWPFAPTNPIYINGREVRGATPLRENDEIRLGDTLFVFKTMID